MGRIILLCCALLLAVLACAEEANYRLAPQDKLTISVLKHPELSGNYIVPPDGTLDIPRAGRVTVTGKTTSELATELQKAFAEFLVNPEVTVSITEARTRSAYVMGAVAKPGQYPILPGTRVTELLAAAGDLVGERNELTAKLIRGQTTLPLDLQAALSGKSPEANLPVQEGDLLWIEAPAKITVWVSGQVKNPGSYKLRTGATVGEALAAAGDILDRPEKMKLTLQRGPGKEPLAWTDTKRTLQDGDFLFVEREPVVRIYVNGQVRNPGMYELPDGGGVLQAITLAGGAIDNAALDQVTLVHQDGASLKINLAPAMTSGDVSATPKLASGDQVIVPQITAKFAVLGTVRNPGTFPLVAGKPITIVDAIGLAGGQDRNAKLTDVALIHSVNGKPERTTVDVNAILTKGQYEKNVQVQTGDIIYVPSKRGASLAEILDSAYKAGILISVL